MSRTQAVVVLGASGSVGNALIRELIRNGSFRLIVTIVRRSFPDQVTLARGAGERRGVLEIEQGTDPEADYLRCSSQPTKCGEIVEVLRHYNAAPAAPEGHIELKPLKLGARELRQLEAFLRTLSGGTTSLGE